MPSNNHAPLRIALAVQLCWKKSHSHIKTHILGLLLSVRVATESASIRNFNRPVWPWLFDLSVRKLARNLYASRKIFPPNLTFPQPSFLNLWVRKWRTDGRRHYIRGRTKKLRAMEHVPSALCISGYGGRKESQHFTVLKFCKSLKNRGSFLLNCEIRSNKAKELH